MSLDVKYWESFYKSNPKPFKESLFANFCIEHFLKKDDVLLELGCGNGRDAIYFMQNGINVKAVDSCKSEIEFLEQKYKNAKIEFLCDDFCKLSAENNVYDIIYSRFTIHSIDNNQQKDLFKWVEKAIKKGGLFCIEVRGFKNSLYKKGKQISQNEFIHDGHYRRFLNFDLLCKDLTEREFEILFSKEDIGFAPFEDEDDYFIRVIAKKI